MALFLGTIGLTAWLANQMYLVLSVGKLVTVEIIMLVLFVINMGWISFGAVSTVLGLLSTPPPRQRSTEPLKGRTALLLPVYNEDTADFTGTACATLRALAAEGWAMPLTSSC